MAAPQILLVDDNPTNLQVLYQTLEGHGYRLLAARSGKDALAIAQRAAPDLILLDVMMPEMDGFETCARLKADARTRDSAVIFLSALTEPRDKVRGLELGAVDFVNKPFQAEEVLARVRTHLTIRELQKQLRRRNEELEHELPVAQELLREARDRTDGVLLGDSAAAVRLRHDIQEAAAVRRAAADQRPAGQRPRSGGARRPPPVGARDARDHLRQLSVAAVRRRRRRARRARAPTSSTSCASRTAARCIWKAFSISRTIRSRRSPSGSGARRGATRRRSAEPDVRVIVSTTRDVDEELAAGRLIPELRRALPQHDRSAAAARAARGSAALAPHILRRQAEQAGRTVPIISEESLQRLQHYRWPGNLRELRNVLGFALAASQGPVLEIGEHLLDNDVRVGSYSLIERLGAGGMGEVWLARHQLLARPAAVKIVREAALGGGEDGHVRRQRFAREAQATAELQSPHTVQLYDFGITDAGSFYYVMERLRGMDLQRMVERHGPLPPERVVFLLKQACLSLAEAHALGLVHRDIKPANLFVCRLGSEFDFLKVLDFGVVSRHGARRRRRSRRPAWCWARRRSWRRSWCRVSALRRPRRHLRARLRRLLAAHRPAAVRGRRCDVGADASRADRAGAAVDDVARSRSRRRSMHWSSSAWPRIRRAGRPAPRRSGNGSTACRVAGEWNQRRARTWWEMHEPELIAPA